MAGHIFYLRTRPVSMVSIWSVCCTDSSPEGALTASFTPATDSPSLPAKRKISLKKYLISPNTAFIMISFSYEIIKCHVLISYIAQKIKYFFPLKSLSYRTFKELAVKISEKR